MKRPPEDCQRKIYEEWKVLQEQRAEEAVVLVHKKHKLYKMEDERQRARTLQRREVTRTTSPWSGGQGSSFESCSSSYAPSMEETMSARLPKELEMDKAVPVGDPWTITKGNSMDHEGEKTKTLPQQAYNAPPS